MVTSSVILRAVAAFTITVGVVPAFAAGCGGGADDTGTAGNAAGGAAAGGAAAGGAAAGGAAAGGAAAGGAAAGSTGTAGGAGHGAGGATGAAGVTGSTGGSGGTGGGVLCNDLTVTGDFIPQTAGTGTMPTPTGGSIADGTYVLTKVEVYSPLTPDATSLKVTMKIAGKTLQSVTASNTSAATATASYTTAVFGTNWALTGTCPSAAITPATPPRFTATAITLVLYIAGQVQTYAKQ
jgi:hypothetical protein